MFTPPKVTPPKVTPPKVTPPKVTPPKVTPPKKNMRYTAVELEQIRMRREKLQQEKDQAPQVLQQLLEEKEKTDSKARVAAINKTIVENKNKIIEEEKAIEALTLVKIGYSMTSLSDLSDIEFLPQDQEIVSSLITLVQLIKNKFAISQLSGEFNLLDKENMTIHFPTGNVVVSREKYEFQRRYDDNYVNNPPSPREFEEDKEEDKLEGQPAIEYFKALGCPAKKKKGVMPFLDAMVVMLPISKCEEAIRGLPLMGSPTLEEREFRKHATIQMTC